MIKQIAHIPDLVAEWIDEIALPKYCDFTTVQEVMQAIVNDAAKRLNKQESNYLESDQMLIDIYVLTKVGQHQTQTYVQEAFESWKRSDDN
ncbi:hypothetical protein FHQ08_11975 [Lactobacillus sp. CC-MHH1034]|uniref:hypothetical protein n=1 Tax=Agrilactobacillus fermenti TaxID=2586909 RepID=UPI001E2A4373|nr:hypothetical protein [Agrilactobacillus fermenti]MCD2257404.1 hypothetical protein [Agrilactobacillus fermenti]